MGTSKERGAAMVEMALVLPILFLLCFGVLEYGYRFMKESQLNNFAYIEARYHSVHDAPSPDMSAKLADATPNGSTPKPAVFAYPTVCPPEADRDGDENVRVTIDVKMPSVTGLLGFLPGINGDGTVTYHAEGVARCDG